MVFMTLTRRDSVNLILFTLFDQSESSYLNSYFSTVCKTKLFAYAFEAISAWFLVVLSLYRIISIQFVNVKLTRKIWFQSVLMAPTEILAQQHLNTITAQLQNLPINIKLLTGSTKTKLRKPILAGCEDGSIHILIGTHAIIEDNVTFKNLGKLF